MLLERVGSFSEQVKGFIDDNPNLNHVLEQLRTISDVLIERRFDLMDTLTTVANFVASLGEAVASGPYFKVMLVNLLPGQILQPFVDAAFKKRGIDPEKFWGDAGLPAWRFPDPNGQRFPNGAPAPGADDRWKARPSIPVPGCSRARRARTRRRPTCLPRPGDPLPCADLTHRSVRRSRRTTARPTWSRRTRTRTVPASRRVCPPRPSRVSCRRTCPARRVPLPPAPPGARTVPVGPLPPEPPDFTPGIAPLPPALTGPPPPPGPGPDAGPGRHAAVARQPAVPPARIAGRG